MQDLGQVLKECRNEAGLSQSDVADAIHVSRQSISKWENNSQLPDISRVRDMCNLYGVSVDCLMEKMEPAEVQGLDNKGNFDGNVQQLMENLRADYEQGKKRTYFDESVLLLIILGVCACLPIIDLIAPWLVIWKNKKTNRYYWWINAICVIMWFVSLSTYGIAYVMSERFI
ncbi:helix-turn-helix domain-containing protein [Weissella ceti]|uniref:Helix-turn-helix domain-containing protein n=1 Tax=Weissella ceti TaxID=759620 RepID=A0ABT3E4W4_9LACO|nr:helix-turn-helix domain-containing protein [Weissella ceti]MCW0953453.1 helix-turn-helix domain-containing protein [Weissella ceti]QVK12055.1 helix-turn-helix domain-containing protein [Weissella ceti]